MLFSPPQTSQPQAFALEKLHRIARWRAEVDRNHAPSNGPYIAPLIPTNSFDPTQNLGDMGFHGSLEQYHQAMDDDFDMDRWTFVFEGDGRVNSLPHPIKNPLVTADLELLQREYISVLQTWNEFEVEKWRAEKMLRGAATPDNIQRVFIADHAIEAASSAARYIEMHAKQLRLQYNFEALFFQVYQPQGFGFYLPEDSYDSPFTVQTPSPFTIRPPHVDPQRTPVQIPACTPRWMHLPSAMPSRMIEV